MSFDKIILRVPPGASILLAPRAPSFHYPSYDIAVSHVLILLYD
jgi:hypothetical protein